MNITTMTFAARDFSARRGASDEHTLQRSVRSEQRSLGQKDMPPGGLHRIWLLALLLLGHRSLRICSLVAPRQKPNAVQQMPTQFVNSTLDSGRVLGGADGIELICRHILAYAPLRPLFKIPAFRRYVEKEVSGCNGSACEVQLKPGQSTNQSRRTA